MKRTGLNMEDKSRRTFLNRLTGAVVGLGAVVTGWPMLRSLFPNVLYEPPRRFSIGLPASYPQGVTFLDEHRIYVFRSSNQFHVVSGICSHLGCTVKFAPFTRERELTVRKHTFQATGEFHCPCHGSKFHGDGTNYSGPAPRPLQWFVVEVSPNNGELLVDLSIEVDREFRLVV